MQAASRLQKTLLDTVVTPIKAFRLRYLPLLMIYFAYGASGFIGIADSFFVKERLAISAVGLISIGVWLGIPWTIKMVFGQFVDSINFFGSRRRSYIFLAASLMVVFSVLLTGLAAKWSFVMALGAPIHIYFVANMIAVIGVVLQDVVADAMSVEVVDRAGRTEKEINHDLAMVQLLGRLSLSLAVFLVSGLGGWLAQRCSYSTMYALTLIIPCISVTGCLLAKIDIADKRPLQPMILFGGIAFGAFVIVMGLCQVAYCQEIVVAVSLVVIVYFLTVVTKSVSVQQKKRIFAAAIVIFVFRAMPSVGPGLQWWHIDVLGFNKAFFGTLAQIGAGLSIIGMWVLARYVTEKPISQIIIVLTVISTLLSLPVIGLYYGLHHWTQEVFGFGAHTIALVDTALASPFAQLSMIPMLTLIAATAPRGNAATWFALMASFMNLALTAGSIASKWLNQTWTVSREVKSAAGVVTTPADYSHLGILLWITTIASFVLPIVAVLLFMRGGQHKAV
jgi:hypothetical protein